MKVKNCTQVFSHTVATAMNVAARTSVELSPDSEFYLDPKADLLMFFDRLFDSINGTLLYPLPGKELRCCDKKNRSISNSGNHVYLFCHLCILQKKILTFS
jgi:hypothetical protein